MTARVLEVAATFPSGVRFAEVEGVGAAAEGE